jgi:2-oxoglutarate ferredoxin oxidoreductase subunit alpha
MPVIASSTPSDCFDVAYEAVRIAVQHMTPVIILSDGYIANGAEPLEISAISRFAAIGFSL